MSKDNPIDWLGNVPVKRFTREWLTEEANKAGKKIAHFAGLLLDDEADRYLLDAVDTSDSVVWARDYFAEEQRNRNAVKTATAIYLDNPDDKKLELLGVICKRVGMSTDEAIVEAQADPFSAMAARRSMETALGRCVGWLVDLMVQCADGVDSSTVATLASEEGFSSSTLNRAKQFINRDDATPTIISKKEGRGWIWVLEQHEVRNR